MNDEILLAALSVWATQNKDDKEKVRRINSEDVDFNWQGDKAIFTFRSYQLEIDCSSSPARIEGSVKGEVRFSSNYISALEVNGQRFSSVTVNDKKRITIDNQEFRFDL